MNELVLTGLDGSNPLGFMAALGIMEALTDCGENARLAWRDDGVFRPVLSGVELDPDVLIALLDRDRATTQDDPALALEYDGTRDLKPPPEVFRHYLRELVMRVSPQERRSVDWASSFATDVGVDNNGATKPTALHFSAGQQKWLEMVRRLAGAVTPDDLREAVFGPWTYTRELPVMGWDATSARDYALRASNPSKDKKAGIPGADWLAIRGLATLSVVPRGTRIHTTGCTGEWKTGRFTWPLWDVAIGRDVIRSLVRTRGLQSIPEDSRRLRGIAAVFQSGIRRSDQGGYGSFSPASVV